MKKFDVVQAWIDNVAYSHSGSKSTEYKYKLHIGRFCEFIGKTPEQILEDYEAMRDRDFRRKYAQYARAWISKQIRSDYAIGSLRNMITTIKSFFKYNDLPLGHVPIARNKVIYHNRDMNKEEIVEILKISRVRDQAFFCMMAQGGFRPDTLCNLRFKHIEPEFSKGIVPCKVEIPEELAKGEFGAYFTFIGEESVKYLKNYLKTRVNIGPEDYLLTAHGIDKRCNPKSMSRIFVRAIEKLKAKGIMDFEQKEEGKPRTVRLYNLRKFFRKQAGHSGVEYVNFWMGHKSDYKAKHIPASDVHYFSREDVEFQRQLYNEKAMPFLRLETATPSETEQTIKELRKQLEQRDRDFAELHKKIAIFEDPTVAEALEKHAETLKGLRDALEENEELRKKIAELEPIVKKFQHPAVVEALEREARLPSEIIELLNDSEVIENLKNYEKMRNELAELRRKMKVLDNPKLLEILEALEKQ